MLDYHLGHSHSDSKDALLARILDEVSTALIESVVADVPPAERAIALASGYLQFARLEPRRFGAPATTLAEPRALLAALAHANPAAPAAGSPVVHIASSLHQLREMAQLRAEVLAAECNYFPTPLGGLLWDEHDFERETVHVCATAGTRVVGTTRGVIVEAARAPMRELYDFTNLVAGRRVMFGGMMCTAPDVRGARLVERLLSTLRDAAVERGVDMICGVVSPPAEASMARCGYRSLGERFLDNRSGLWVKPVLLTLS